MTLIYSNQMICIASMHFLMVEMDLAARLCTFRGKFPHH